MQNIFYVTKNTYKESEIYLLISLRYTITYGTPKATLMFQACPRNLTVRPTVKYVAEDINFN